MRILKETTIEVKELRIPRAKELIVKEVEAKLKILVEKDVWVDFIAEQIV